MGLGAILREAREQRHLSVAEVATATRMKAQVVQALENEDFGRLAAPVYGRGFIKLYARHMGLDPEPLIADYMARVSARRDPVIPHLAARATRPVVAAAPSAAPPPVAFAEAAPTEAASLDVASSSSTPENLIQTLPPVTTAPDQTTSAGISVATPPAPPATVASPTLSLSDMTPPPVAVPPLSVSSGVEDLALFAHARRPAEQPSSPPPPASPAAAPTQSLTTPPVHPLPRGQRHATPAWARRESSPSWRQALLQTCGRGLAATGAAIRTFVTTQLLPVLVRAGDWCRRHVLTARVGLAAALLVVLVTAILLIGVMVRGCRTSKPTTTSTTITSHPAVPFTAPEAPPLLLHLRDPRANR